eukprot:scaffold266727_cov32-Tisochrysis_lutea.AAC.2
MLTPPAPDAELVTSPPYSSENQGERLGFAGNLRHALARGQPGNGAHQLRTSRSFRKVRPPDRYHETNPAPQRT